MTLRAVEPIYVSRVPLLVLERHALRLDETLVADVRGELLQDVDQSARFRAGFLLGVQADPRSHPSCLALALALRRELLAEFERTAQVEFRLSFFKLAEGRPPTATEGPFYEAPHLDTHPQLSRSTELLRLLVNLSHRPRRFLYVAADRWALAERGVSYGRRRFEQLVVPDDLERRVVLLPARTATTVHALKFFASALPHVGLNDEPEHFLLSFEALADIESAAPISRGIA